MPLPTISIAVPYYRDLDLLRAALQSLTAQDDPDWTAVVVDDSGLDEAFAEVVGLGDPRVTVVANDRTLGVAGNFNRSTELGRGSDLLTLLHADDELSPDYVRTVRTVAAAHPAATMVVPRAQVIDAAGRPTRTVADTVKDLLWPRRGAGPDGVVLLAGDRALRHLLHGQFLHCPAVAFRTAHLPPEPWDARWRQVMDLDLFGRLVLRGGSMALVRDRCYRYRRHDATTTEAHSGSTLRTTEEHAVCGELADEAAALGWRRAARAGRWRMTVRMQAVLRAVSALAGRRPRLAADHLAAAVGRGPDVVGHGPCPD